MATVLLALVSVVCLLPVVVPPPQSAKTAPTSRMQSTPALLLLPQLAPTHSAEFATVSTKVNSKKSYLSNVDSFLYRSVPNQVNIKVES